MDKFWANVVKRIQDLVVGIRYLPQAPAGSVTDGQSGQCVLRCMDRKCISYFCDRSVADAGEMVLMQVLDSFVSFKQNFSLFS